MPMHGSDASRSEVTARTKRWIASRSSQDQVWCAGCTLFEGWVSDQASAPELVTVAFLVEPRPSSAGGSNKHCSYNENRHWPPRDQTTLSAKRRAQSPVHPADDREVAVPCLRQHLRHCI